MTHISPYKVSFWLIATMLIGVGLACSIVWAAPGLLGLCVLLVLVGISLVIVGSLGEFFPPLTKAAHKKEEPVQKVKQAEAKSVDKPSTKPPEVKKELTRELTEDEKRARQKQLEKSNAALEASGEGFLIGNVLPYIFNYLQQIHQIIPSAFSRLDDSKAIYASHSPQVRTWLKSLNESLMIGAYHRIVSPTTAQRSAVIESIFSPSMSQTDINSIEKRVAFALVIWLLDRLRPKFENGQWRVEWPVEKDWDFDFYLPCFSIEWGSAHIYFYVIRFAGFNREKLQSLLPLLLSQLQQLKNPQEDSETSSNEQLCRKLSELIRPLYQRVEIQQIDSLNGQIKRSKGGEKDPLKFYWRQRSVLERLFPEASWKLIEGVEQSGYLCGQRTVINAVFHMLTGAPPIHLTDAQAKAQIQQLQNKQPPILIPTLPGSKQPSSKAETSQPPETLIINLEGSTLSPQKTKSAQVAVASQATKPLPAPLSKAISSKEAYIALLWRILFFSLLGLGLSLAFFPAWSFGLGLGLISFFAALAIGVGIALIKKTFQTPIAIIAASDFLRVESLTQRKRMAAHSSSSLSREHSFVDLPSKRQVCACN